MIIDYLVLERQRYEERTEVENLDLDKTDRQSYAFIELQKMDAQIQKIISYPSGLKLIVVNLSLFTDT